MTREEIIKEIDDIRDDVYWASGCSHEDALQDALKEAEQRLAKLLETLAE